MTVPRAMFDRPGRTLLWAAWLPITAVEDPDCLNQPGEIEESEPNVTGGGTIVMPRRSSRVRCALPFGDEI